MPYGVTVTVVRSGGIDTRTGDAVATVVEIDYPGCAVWPQGSGEQTFQQDLVPAGYAVLLPPGAVVTAQDRVRLFGRVWDVEGEPAVWQSNLTGFRAGVQVAVRRTEG